MRLLIQLLLFTGVVSAQNVASHQWENRVLIISGTKSETTLVEQQFQQFKNKSKQLLERKLVLYKCINDNCMFYNWIDKPKPVKIKNTFPTFSILLIGLDGGKKYTSHKLQQPNAIFKLIDTMPMRAQELLNKHKN